MNGAARFIERTGEGRAGAGSFVAPDDQFGGQRHLLRFHAGAGDVVSFGDGLMEMEEEGLFDAGAFLVDGVAEGVGEGFDALFYLPVAEDFAGSFLAVFETCVEVGEFITVVHKVLERNAFGMLEKEQIDETLAHAGKTGTYKFQILADATVGRLIVGIFEVDDFVR